MKGHKIGAYIGLFLLAFDGTTTILNFSLLNAVSTLIAFMIVFHHTMHYKELKALKQVREETAYVVTTANDVLAPLNKQFLISPKDFQYHLRFWPCTRNTIVTEGLEYTWYGVKKNDTYSSIGGKA